MRKACYGIIALGLLVAVAAGGGDQLTGGGNTGDELWDELRSPLAGVILGIVIRVLASFAALALAYPLARGGRRTSRLVRTSAVR